MTQSRKHAFRPALAPAVLVALLTGLLVWLGTWQLRRADEKRELLAAYEAKTRALPWHVGRQEPDRYARVWLEGRFEPDRQVLLDGMTHETRVGYQVLTPFRLVDGRLVAVNRGWREWQGPRNRLPALPAPTGRRRIEGRVSPFFEPGMRLSGGNEQEAARWPRLAVYPTAEELSRWLAEEVADDMLLLDPAEPDGYVRDWRPARFPPIRHVGYAVQWYSLALALVVLFVFASRKKTEADRE